ncbi:hypothetical protein D3Y57_06990 [Sphingomonas paeninsulae]|uniref:Uncharacterized protein n=1 Tax=Sphingomonas paeninsulae TaxID=2319844 RepID=A0A494TFI3_SPHPE|nr:VapE domain-containing protein [Sphingomonas paeninsulae]AYJ85763.1 hypothetical protein D3Y57_06990 [Sphingomonas paeninsulae]
MSALLEPSQSEVERAFSDAMAAAGYLPGPIEPDTADFVRFDAPGDKAGRRNGFYKLKLGKYPVGWFGEWKTGESNQWHYDFGRELTTKERGQIKAEQRRMKAEAEVARETRQAEVAEDASRMWGEAKPDVESHPYLERKLITIPRGLRQRTAKDGTALLCVPMYSFDMAGNPALTNLQTISPNGEKRFMKSGRVAGTFFSLKGDSSLIVICEGVATGFSIWKATGAGVVCAFNSGNLIEVAKEMARHRPLATLLIAGDNDEIAPHDWAERGNGRPWVNTGRIKAEAAAKTIGCRWVLPYFKDGAARGRTDFNDLHELQGEQAVGGQIMGAMRSVEAEDTQPGATLVEVDFLQDESWRGHIPTTPAGHPDGNNVEGVANYISNHKLLRGRLGFNAFTQAVELDGNEMADHHVAEFRRIMHFDRFKAKKGDVADEMLAEARRNSRDPLSEYLHGVVWDAKPRLNTWLVDYLGSPPSSYTREVGRKFLIGAVARALKPGCKMDTMMVLEGDQGTGKSTAIRYLFGDRFFIDHLPDFHSKDSFMQLQGAWAVEVGELAAMSKADVNDVKLFLSRLVDKFRPPFGKLTVSVPRRTAFVGSVNPEEGGGYLRDPTGARRFWPVATGNIRLESILRDRDQLWAEAVHAWGEGEEWYLTDPDIIAEAKVEQEARREVDPWESVIQAHVSQYCLSYTTIDVMLTEALKLPVDRQDPRARRRAGAALRAIKWSAGKAERLGRGAEPVKVFRPIVAVEPDTRTFEQLAHGDD